MRRGAVEVGVFGSATRCDECGKVEFVEDPSIATRSRVPKGWWQTAQAMGIEHAYSPNIDLCSTYCLALWAKKNHEAGR